MDKLFHDLIVAYSTPAEFLRCSRLSSRPVEYAGEYFTGDMARPDMGSELLMFMRVLYHI